jgi:hypothetical protein
MSSLIFLASVIQLIIALGLLNVWVVRFNRPTGYRGGAAQTLPQEFAAYGLPSWFVYVIGFLKISIALVLIAAVIVPAALGMIPVYALVLLAILMFGAIIMHLKVHDPIKKFLPAVGVLTMTVAALLILVSM